jgi:hypothetical protein
VSFHRRLDAFLRAAQAAHATYSVYVTNSKDLHEGTAQKRLMQHCERISRLPSGDISTGNYPTPPALRELSESIRNQLANLSNGAIDEGNGDVLDAQIDASVSTAHFELEIEHSLYESATQLLVMRNRGDATITELQLEYVRKHLAHESQIYAECRDAFEQAGRPRSRGRGRGEGDAGRSTARNGGGGVARSAGRGTGRGGGGGETRPEAQVQAKAGKNERGNHV